MKIEKKAIVNSTNQEIVVYKLKSGKWCDSINCTTQYDSKDLTFLN